MSSSYEEIKKNIIDTLTGREEGTMIQPEDHQNFALQLNDYIHSVELSCNGGFIACFDNPNIYPIQTSEQNSVYFFNLERSTTVTFTNFIDNEGNPIIVSTNAVHVALVTLIWNRSFWQKNVLQIPVGGSGGDLTLSQLSDVLLQDLGDGNVLSYSASQQKWINKNIQHTSILMNNQQYSRNQNGIIDLGTVITQHQDISGKEDKINKITAFQSTPDNTHYPSEKLVKDSLDGKIDTTKIGVAGGVAELDANGLVPASQLPSYVDDVKEYSSLSMFPVTGEADMIYIALDTNLTYRWGGSSYVPVGNSLALGETSSTAYRGDRGKAAYDHSQLTSGNPHNVTASDLNLSSVATSGKYKDLSGKPTDYIEIVYLDLVRLINDSKLQRGFWYRITDYVTTTSKTNTISAGNAFDLFVLAKSGNELFSEALAISNDNETYFDDAGADLSKWKIWYDYENNTNKYDWADTNNGKGVIYRMIDEWGNDFPYDFKNIQFKIGARTNSGTVNNVYYYTFSYASGLSDTYIDDLSFNGKCRNNMILGSVHDANGVMKLPFTVFREATDSTRGFVNNIMGLGCNNNTFGESCNSNTLGESCSNTDFGKFCSLNTIGKQSTNTEFGNNCVGNTIGMNCVTNTILNNNYYNYIGDACIYIYLTDYCREITIGKECYAIILCDLQYINGNYYRNITVNSGNRYISLHNTQTTPAQNNYLQNVVIESDFNLSNNFYDISSITRGRSYTTKVAKDSSNNVVIYCEEDSTALNSMDFSFIEETINQTVYAFDSLNGRNYIYAEINNNVTISLKASNHAENYIRFYNSSVNDVNVTISSIEDGTTGISINDSWVGVKTFAVEAGKYVELSSVINIPDSSTLSLSTILISDNYSAVV